MAGFDMKQFMSELGSIIREDLDREVSNKMSADTLPIETDVATNELLNAEGYVDEEDNDADTNFDDVESEEDDNIDLESLFGIDEDLASSDILTPDNINDDSVDVDAILSQFIIDANTASENANTASTNADTVSTSADTASTSTNTVSTNTDTASSDVLGAKDFSDAEFFDFANHFINSSPSNASKATDNRSATEQSGSNTNNESSTERGSTESSSNTEIEPPSSSPKKPIDFEPSSNERALQEQLAREKQLREEKEAELRQLQEQLELQRKQLQQVSQPQPQRQPQPQPQSQPQPQRQSNPRPQPQSASQSQQPSADVQQFNNMLMQKNQQIQSLLDYIDSLKSNQAVQQTVQNVYKTQQPQERVLPTPRTSTFMGEPFQYTAYQEPVTFSKKFERGLDDDDTAQNFKDVVDEITKDIEKKYGGWGRITSMAVVSNILILNGMSYEPKLPQEYIDVMPYDVRNNLTDGQFAWLFHFGVLRKMKKLTSLKFDTRAFVYGKVRIDLGVQFGFTPSWFFKHLKALQYLQIGETVITPDKASEQDSLFKRENRVAELTSTANEWAWGQTKKNFTSIKDVYEDPSRSGLSKAWGIGWRLGTSIVGAGGKVAVEGAGLGVKAAKGIGNFFSSIKQNL